MRKNMLDTYIEKLQESFGPVRRPVDDEKLEVIYQEGDIARLIGHIATLLRIDVTLRVGYVNSGGPKKAPAFVSFEQPFPQFGTEAFKRSLVTVYLRKGFLRDATFECIVTAIAHELSHVLLEATGHVLRKQEAAVDLTAMLLGFRDFYITGSVYRQGDGQITLGYLSAEEIRYAALTMTYGQ